MANHVVDAKNKHLGRIASTVAYFLQGKDTAAYNPRNAGDNRVIVKNVHLLKVSGAKEDQKVYYRHTGYVGHLKRRKYQGVFSGSPEWVLRHAVAGMLPKNSLRAKRLMRLVFEK